jgi:hypothetical protein
MCCDRGIISRGDTGALRTKEDEIEAIVDEGTVAVHRELGPGLLGLAYKVVLPRQFPGRGLKD